MTAAQIPLPVRNDYTIAPANLGVYFDRSPLVMPDGSMVDCRNVRIQNGVITNRNMGWDFFDDEEFPYLAPVTLIDTFTSRAGVSVLIAGTASLVAQYTGSKFVFLNPIVASGAAAVSKPISSLVVTGAGETFIADGVEAGDYLYFTSATRRDVGIEGYEGWFEIDSVDSETQLTLLPGFDPAHTNLPYTNVAYTILKALPFVEGSVWSTAMFPDAQPANEDTWYATNGSAIIKWNGSDAEFTDVTATLGFTCKALHFHKNMLLYGNLTESGDNRPNSVRNSAIATPESITPGTLEATEFVVSEGVEELLSFKKLGDYVIAYCENSVNACQFVGPPVFFAVRTAVPSIGPVAPRAVVNFGDHHRFLADDRGYYFDGVSLQEYGSHVLREVLRRYDRNRSQYVSTLVDEENGELHWIIPLVSEGPVTYGDGPSTAFTEHYLEQVGRKPQPFTIRDLPATAAGNWLDTGQKRFSDLAVPFSSITFRWNDRFFSSAFPITVFGTPWGTVATLGTVNTQTLPQYLIASPINSYVRFPRRPSWDTRSKGIVVRVEPFTETEPNATYSLTCALWGIDFAEGERTKLAEQEFDLTHSGKRWVSFMNACLFHEIVFSTNATNAPWAITGYRVTTTQGGAI